MSPWHLRLNLAARLVDLILVLAVLLVGWVVGREVLGIGGPEREQERDGREAPFAVAVSELGQTQWRVGTIARAGQGAVYEASVLDTTGQTLFKLKIDASTGKVLGKGEQVSSEPAPATLSDTDIKKSVEAILGDLLPGPVQRKGNEPFLAVPLTYQGREVARIKVNATSRQVVPESRGNKEGGGEKAKVEGEVNKDGKRGGEGKLVPRNLVVHLGWGAAVIMIISSAYYSWKRSLFSPLRAAAGEAKARAVAGLRRTLWWHMTLGLVALAIAVFHVLNFTARIQLSVSWLTLGMAIGVALSGAFGKFMARSETVRHNWRRFHVPYTVLFFVVLFIHILEKTKVLGD